MSDGVKANDGQGTLWNGAAGQAWVASQGLLDGLLRPFEDLLVRAVADVRARTVVDVGCGARGTTLAAARTVGANGHCTGLDISAPMIEAARARAAQEGVTVDFVRGDAQTMALPPSTFDMIISRFGVMFFEDPVQAFANLRKACREGGAMCVIAWRSADENPFLTAAEKAAVSVLPDAVLRRPGGPGPFAFADPDVVRRVLVDSGWADVDITPVDAPCVMPESALVSYFTSIGPLGTVFREADDSTRTRLIEVVRPAFDPYVHGDEVRFDAACWVIRAKT